MINRLIKGFFIALTLVSCSGQQAPEALNSSQEGSNFPITVESCGQPVTFDAAPTKALVFDTNMTEIMLALGLEDNLAGYWISGVPVSEEYSHQIAGVPLISEATWPPPNKEQILSFDPDFVFGGWGYVFYEESGVTPMSLATLGVKSYTLTETCITEGVSPDETIESVYQDILNISKIFGVQDRGHAIVSQMRSDIEMIQEKIGIVETPLRAFYYGGGADAAFSAGRYANVTKLMVAVGAENILGHIEDQWIPEVSWEFVIENDPEVIIIDDTPWESAQARIETLKSLPQLADVTAIREERFVIMPWTYILPGVDIDEGIGLLASSLYPEAFYNNSE